MTRRRRRRLVLLFAQLQPGPLSHELHFIAVLGDYITGFRTQSARPNADASDGGSRLNPQDGDAWNTFHDGETGWDQQVRSLPDQ